MRTWLFLFVVALLLRLAMLFYWEHRIGADTFYFGDSDTYWVLGKTIAEGEPYVYKGNAIHRMPGYPALLAPLFWLFDDGKPLVFVARIQVAVIGSLTVLATVWLTTLLFKNRTTAFFAGLFTAIDPLNIVMSVLILSEAPFCLAMMLQLIFWTKGVQTLGKNANRINVKTFAFLVTTGLLTAAAIYIRPSWLHFVPFATILGVILSPRNYKSVLISGMFVTAVGVLCLCPWWYRNYLRTGHFVSTTLQAGASLYDGLNPQANGGSDMRFVEDFRNAEMKQTPNISEQTLEYRLNRKLRQTAVHWAMEHPAAAWKLVYIKFFRLWNFIPNEPSFSNRLVQFAVFCTYSPILILGLIGALRSFRYDFSVRLLWIPAVYITALHIIFVSSLRYRAPAMICFAVLAAWTVTSFFLSRNTAKGTK